MIASKVEHNRDTNHLSRFVTGIMSRKNILGAIPGRGLYFVELIIAKFLSWKGTGGQGLVLFRCRYLRGEQ